jgi:hypothetical protein
MRLSAQGLLASPRFGALLAFLTLGIILPSTARAGCLAHYITSRSQISGEMSHLELLGNTGALAIPRDQTPLDRPAPPPCSGALCSGNPAAPLPTMPSIAPTVGGHWAVLALPITLVGTGSFRCLPVDPSLRPVDHPCLIFHPPRFQAEVTTF